jgi:hypothetical protein
LVPSEGSALTRRQLFVHAGGAAALAYAAARLPAGAVAPPAREPLTLAEVLPHVGSRFDVWVKPLARERVTLIEATGRTPRSQGGRQVTGEAFSLLFDAGRSRVPAGTHLFRHPALGWFTLFVSPVGRGLNGQRYEAIVNRLALVP